MVFKTKKNLTQRTQSFNIYNAINYERKGVSLSKVHKKIASGKWKLFTIKDNDFYTPWFKNVI